MLKGHNLLTGDWKRRWCVLSGSVLVFFDNETENKCTGQKSAVALTLTLSHVPTLPTIFSPTYTH